MTRRAPGRRVAHFNDRTTFGGGTLSDSARGSRRAAREGYDWIDCNGHLTADLFWVNAHGSPFSPSWLRGKFEDHKLHDLRRTHPGLRTAAMTFKQNAHLGLNTEWEVKDLHPHTSHADLVLAFQRLASSAESAYGPRWRKHVQVKVLTNLRGGVKYARKVCLHAHAAGFDTIILPRGAARLLRFRAPYITWRR